MFLQKILLDWSSPLDNGRNDIVFENRNKQYGAYTIRRDYDQVLLFSVLGATALFLALTSTQFLFKNEIVRKISDDTGPIVIENTVHIEKKDQPILEPIKKIEPPKEALTKPAAPIKGVNFNNLIIDDHSRVNTNVPVIPDANANPNATNTNTDPTPPVKLPENNTGGTGGAGNTNSNSNEIVQAPDILPSFVGGEVALAMFFKKHVEYPRISIENDEQSKVFVKFVVEKDGSIGLAEVVKGGKYAALNKEALRVVKSMPNWNPGMSGGKPARVYFYVPINFVLADN